MKQMSAVIVVLLFVFQNLYSKTINIPNDQPLIQVGIVSSSNGDTILVSPGTYSENINFNGKNIVLGSLFLTTGDTSYISQTIIDGNQQGCVIVFENGEDSTAVLTGFTIMNGYSYLDSLRGGGITCVNLSSPKLMYLNIKNNIVLGESGHYGGGGVLCSGNSKATIYESIIQNNITDDAFELNLSGGFGGGVFCDDSSSIRIINSSVKSNSARFGGGITSYNSLLEINTVDISENNARNGSGLFLYESNVKIDNSIVSKHTYQYNRAGGGIYARTTELIIRNSQIVDNFANGRTSFQAPTYGGGIYLLTSCIATIEDSKINNNISANGGGICVWESEIIIRRSEINGNIGDGFGHGGGISIFNPDKNTFLEDVIISDNFSNSEGGGLYYLPNQPIEAMKNVIIRNNTCGNVGGGLATNSNLLIPQSSGCSITLNKAKSGRDIYIEIEDFNSINTIYLDTVTVSDPADYHISPIKNIDLHYKHALFQNVNTDLYVSPYGNDSNSGVSKDEALRTISHALLVTGADNINPRTIFLAPGTYSSSTNGDEFPIYSRDYISIKGQRSDSTILRGDGNTRIIELNNRKELSFENLTITNGYSNYGAGLLASGGDRISLKNLIISDNTSVSGGIGINVSDYNRVSIINTTIANNNSLSNDSSRSGGIYTAEIFELSIINSIIYNNHPINLIFNEMPSFLPPYSGYNNIAITHSNIEGGRDGIYIDGDSIIVNWFDGNIDTDPLFVGGNPFDYNLSDSSPCINAGTPFFVWEGDTLINLSPSEYIGEAPDMGAMESDVLISVEGEETIPMEYKLEQNYPNPFNPSTTIKYEIPDQARNDNVLVKLKIYDVLGREVATLVNKEQSAGSYEVQFDARNLSSGIYYYWVTSGSFVKTMKMILLK